MDDYKVQFEVFEGPLDLLLYLVKKEEVDIYQVNLTRLATEFLEYVELMRQLDLDVAGEFLVMAATLLCLKSRELLPVDQQAPGGEEEGDDASDPRWELIRKLVEYKKFKDAAAQLHELETLQEATFARQPPKPVFDRPAARTDVSLFDLIGAVGAILKRFQERRETREIVPDRWTVSEKITFIRDQLGRRGSLKFTELFDGAGSRPEIVVTFLALLELVRLRQLQATQTEPFGEIELTAAPDAPPAESVRIEVVEGADGPAPTTTA